MANIANPQGLVGHLERSQLVEHSARPLARAELSRHARQGLWALRILTFALAAMVLTTFAVQLS